MNVRQVKIEALAWSCNHTLGYYYQYPNDTCLNIPQINKNRKDLMTSSISPFNIKKKLPYRVDAQRTIVKRVPERYYQVEKINFC